MALLVGFTYGVESRRLDSIRIVRPSRTDLEWALILFGCHGVDLGRPHGVDLGRPDSLAAG